MSISSFHSEQDIRNIAQGILEEFPFTETYGLHFYPTDVPPHQEGHTIDGEVIAYEGRVTDDTTLEEIEWFVESVIRADVSRRSRFGNIAVIVADDVDDPEELSQEGQMIFYNPRVVAARIL